MKHTRGQAMVEFALTIGLLMLIVVMVTQLAIYLHYRSSLDTAAKEGAFQAALVGHSLADGERATRQLWASLEPGADPIQVQASRNGDLVEVSAQGTAPAIAPLPMRLAVSVHAAHSVERFQPGAAP
jgi:Flp pilus assembly protein TadG